MKVRKGIVSAAIAVLALGSAAWADDSVSVATPTDGQNVIVPAAQIDTQSYDQTIFADDTTPPPPPEHPLMMLLDKAGVGKTLENYGINVGGYAELSYMWDFTKPSGAGDPDNFDGPYKNTFDINQIDLEIDKTISADPAKFNWGFRVEGLFGRDAAFIHSNGILDNSTKHGGGPKDQVDLEQAYLLINLPVGNGVLLEAGKFVTPLGYETINPTTNPFMSRSFSFEFGIPLTQTGITATYSFTPNLTVMAGFTRGWNQSTNSLGSVDFLGEVIYKWGDNLTLTGNLSIGQEGNLPFGPPDYKDVWVVPEVIAAYTVTKELSVAADVVYGNAAGDGQWYGVAGYAKYVLSPIITLNGRLEWYDDASGFTTGFGSNLDVYEATAGVTVTPMPNDPILQFLSLRPEIRYDFANHNVFDGGKWGELTAAVDAIMTF